MAKIVDSFTPRQTVKELDKYIIGQANAKRAVAVALRNRSRRRALDNDLRDEIVPKNIIMIGATGVGKTEIARRLAKLANAPFTKVEATKFTEVGYVGRDVESIIRDLTTVGVNLVKKETRKKMESKAKKLAEEELLTLLVPISKKHKSSKDSEIYESTNNTRNKIRAKLQNGELEDKIVRIEVETQRNPVVEVFSTTGIEEMDLNFQNIINSMVPPKTKVQRLSVREAREILIEMEYDRLIDMDKVSSEAIQRVEEMGIVFLDEIDKIVGKSHSSGQDVSREGVQRDILPIIEGSAINTRYGVVKTEHILFIAAGAFHMSKPSDLIPELQGRFPIRVELDSLNKDDLFKILTEPKNSLIKQYKALLGTEGLKVEFENEAIDNLAEIAFHINSRTENIGARRLHTVMEKLLEDISFDAPNRKNKKVLISKKYVNEKLNGVLEDRDLTRYIL